MKSFFKIIIYIFSFFTIYLLQLFIFDNLKISGIKPNIFAISIIIISLYNKPIKSFSIGIIVGIIIDLLNSKAIGITAIGLGLLGYGVSNVEKMFSIESKLSLIVFIFLGTISYEILEYILQFIIIGTKIQLITIIKIILIEAIYNSLLTIIFYPLCKKILKIATEEINKNNINGYLKKMR